MGWMGVWGITAVFIGSEIIVPLICCHCKVELVVFFLPNWQGRSQKKQHFYLLCAGHSFILISERYILNVFKNIKIVARSWLCDREIV